MRKINELLEAHRLIFENVLTSMVMTDSRGYIIRCNRHTEQVDMRALLMVYADMGSCLIAPVIRVLC